LQSHRLAKLSQQNREQRGHPCATTRRYRSRGGASLLVTVLLCAIGEWIAQAG